MPAKRLQGIKFKHNSTTQPQPAPLPTLPLISGIREQIPSMLLSSPHTPSRCTVQDTEYGAAAATTQTERKCSRFHRATYQYSASTHTKSQHNPSTPISKQHTWARCCGPCPVISAGTLQCCTSRASPICRNHCCAFCSTSLCARISWYFRTVSRITRGICKQANTAHTNTCQGRRHLATANMTTHVCLALHAARLHMSFDSV